MANRDDRRPDPNEQPSDDDAREREWGAGYGGGYGRSGEYGERGGQGDFGGQESGEPPDEAERGRNEAPGRDEG